MIYLRNVNCVKTYLLLVVRKKYQLNRPEQTFASMGEFWNCNMISIKSWMLRFDNLQKKYDK